MRDSRFPVSRTRPSRPLDRCPLKKGPRKSVRSVSEQSERGSDKGPRSHPEPSSQIETHSDNARPRGWPVGSMGDARSPASGSVLRIAQAAEKRLRVANRRFYCPPVCESEEKR